MIYEAKRFNKNIKFYVENTEDTIQRCHSRGFYYEEQELLDLSLAVPNGAVILDIGSNVGNHAIYLAIHTGAKCIYPIEPNPVAINILKHNIDINNISQKVNLSFLGYGLSNKRSDGLIQIHPKTMNNLGATSISQCVDGSGEFKIVRGDDLFKDIDAIDFVKIDVEGMELDVLDGMEGIWTRHRPVLYIEVRNPLLPRFNSWLSKLNYRIDRTHYRHKGLRNYLCFPSV